MSCIINNPEVTMNHPLIDVDLDRAIATIMKNSKTKFKNSVVDIV
jgi:hypothetical protein